MEPIDSNSIHLELKYCERCGGLWLRITGSDLIFCAPCAVVMAGLAPNSRFLTRGTGKLRTHQGSIQAAFWSEGGNA